jgi:hypothetical protein
MDYGKILARAFDIARKYRALWLFGILLALFGGSSGGGNFNFGNYGGGSSGRGGTPGGLDGFPTLPSLPRGSEQAIAIIIGAVACFAVAWILLAIILRLISRAALIGLVQELETQDTKPSIGRGFTIGADRFRSLLGVALTINLPLVLFSLGLVLVAALPLILVLVPMMSSLRGAPSSVVGMALAGIFVSIAFLCCIAIVLMLIQIVINPFYEFIVRKCVVDKTGAMDSIREGFGIVRKNLGRVAVLYVLVIAVRIGYGIVMIPVVLVLIAIPAGAGLLTYLLAKSFIPALLVGGILAIPFLLVMLLISGWFHVFDSNVWTLGYLAVTAPAQTKPDTTPAS